MMKQFLRILALVVLMMVLAMSMALAEPSVKELAQLQKKVDLANQKIERFFTETGAMRMIRSAYTHGSAMNDNGSERENHRYSRVVPLFRCQAV